MFEINRKDIIYFFIISIVILITLHGFISSEQSAQGWSKPHFQFAFYMKECLLKYHEFPFWGSHQWGGAPYYSNPSSPMLNPMYLILSLLPIGGILTVNLFVLINTILAAIFMYLLVDYVVKNKELALAGGLVYVLNNYFMHTLYNGFFERVGGYPLIPLAILFILKALDENKIKNILISAIAFAFVFLSGSITYFLYLFVTICFIVVLHGFLSKDKIKKTAIIIIIFTLIAGGLIAIKFFPVQEFLKVTNRNFEMSYQDALGQNMDYLDLTNVQQLFERIIFNYNKNHDENSSQIGIIMAVLAVLGIYHYRKTKQGIIFGLMALLGIFLASKNPISYFLWEFVPGFNQQRFAGKALFIFIIAAIILACLELKRMTEKNKKHLAMILAAGIVLEMIFLHCVFPAYSNYSKEIENNEAFKWISQQNGTFRMHSFQDTGIDTGAEMQLFSSYYGIDSLYGQYTAIWIPEYMQKHMSIAYYNLPTFLGMLNTKYILSDRQLNGSAYKFLTKVNQCYTCNSLAYGPYIYENNKFLPRAYKINSAVLVAGKKDAVENTIYQIMTNDNYDPKKFVLMHGKENIALYSRDELKKYKGIILTEGSLDSGVGELYDYVTKGGLLIPDIANQKTTVTEDELNSFFEKVKNNSGYQELVLMKNTNNKRILATNNLSGYVVLSEKFFMFPGWNGKDNKYNIEKTNGMQSAIYIDGTEDKITLTYVPEKFKTGAIITGVTIVIIILLWRKNFKNN